MGGEWRYAHIHTHTHTRIHSMVKELRMLEWAFTFTTTHIHIHIQVGDAPLSSHSDGPGDARGHTRWRTAGGGAWISLVMDDTTHVSKRSSSQQSLERVRLLRGYHCVCVCIPPKRSTSRSQTTVRATPLRAGSSLHAMWAATACYHDHTTQPTTCSSEERTCEGCD